MIKIKLYCLAALLFFITSCFARERDTTIVSSLTKISFLNPGISYEKRVGKFQSIYGRGFMAVSAYAGWSGSFGVTSGFYLDPGLAIQYRSYYNAEKRKANGKRTEMNSLNYVSAAFETFFSRNPESSLYSPKYNRRAVTTLGFVWGIQRNYPGHFSLDLNVGLGRLFTKEIGYDRAGEIVATRISEVTIMSQFTLGFWLNKRK